MTALAEHLQELEERLLDPELRRSPERLAQLLADDFREFGSSGRAYDKEQVSSALENQIPVHLTLEEFRAVELGPAAALVTYRARAESPGGKADQLSLRSSIWIHRGDDWQMLFHQGTLFAEARTF